MFYNQAFADDRICEGSDGTQYLTEKLLSNSPQVIVKINTDHNCHAVCIFYRHLFILTVVVCL